MSDILDSFEFLTIKYPAGERDEHQEILPVRAITVIDGSLVTPAYELAEHSSFLPLVAGDVVVGEAGLLTDVVRIEPVFAVDVFFDLKYPNSVAEERIAEWMADGYCNAKLPTNMTARLTTKNGDWLRTLRDDEAVHWMDPVRSPNHPVGPVRAALKRALIEGLIT